MAGENDTTVTIEHAPPVEAETTTAPIEAIIDTGVTAGIAEEHASEALETAAETADAVEQLEERAEEWQAIVDRRLSTLEEAISARPTREEMAELQSSILASIPPMPSDPPPNLEQSLETAETLEEIARDPQALEAIAETAELSETNTQEILTEASSEIRTEALSENEEGEQVQETPPVPVRKVRYI